MPRGLPEANLRYSPAKGGTSMRTGYISPAPGRPGQSDVRADKRVRESSGSLLKQLKQIVRPKMMKHLKSKKGQVK